MADTGRDSAELVSALPLPEQHQRREVSTCSATSTSSDTSSLWYSHQDGSTAASRLRRKLRFILLIDTLCDVEEDDGDDGQEQPTVRAKLQECTCPRCSGLLSLRRYRRQETSDDDGDGWHEYYEDEVYEDIYDDEYDEAAAIAEDYESQQLNRSNKRNQKTSNQKEARRIKAVGKASSKTKPKNRFAARAVAVRAAKREEHKQQMAAGGLKSKMIARADGDEAGPVYWERRLAGKSRGRHQHSYRSSARAFCSVSEQREPRQHRYQQQERILPAEQLLGVEDGGDAMYQRLLEIAAGAEITPEDYDLLIMLDENNARSTLQVSQVEQFELLVIADADNLDGGKEQEEKGNHGDDDVSNKNASVVVSRQSLGAGSLCLICLQPFEEVEDGFELRRLPCQHVFCRSCIEPWLSEHSIKCPDLSCFWTSDNAGENADSENNVGGSESTTAVATTSTDVSVMAAKAATRGGVAVSNDNDSGGVGSEAIPDEVTTMSTMLWPIDDVETFLGQSPTQGGLSCRNVLERVLETSQLLLVHPSSDSGTTDQPCHSDAVGTGPDTLSTLMDQLAILWNDMEDQNEHHHNNDDENNNSHQREDVLALYRRFHAAVQEAMQRSGEQQHQQQAGS